MGDLSPHFSRWEFACKCGCGKDDVSMELVNGLEAIRTIIDRPLHITSGLRCANHNAAVGGVPNSAHLRGTAADVAVSGGSNRHEFVWTALDVGMRGIGVAKTFIHVDVDVEVPRPSMWSY